MDVRDNPSKLDIDTDDDDDVGLEDESSDDAGDKVECIISFIGMGLEVSAEIGRRSSVALRLWFRLFSTMELLVEMNVVGPVAFVIISKFLNLKSICSAAGVATAPAVVPSSSVVPPTPVACAGTVNMVMIAAKYVSNCKNFRALC